ncbi:hypothetical protein BDY24DRAFT_415426 [Mrakia frigida]|uniref:Nat2p n=1 Tax=Mrakia frigida TaxID=29902 RepID=UPI003FCBF77F
MSSRSILSSIFSSSSRSLTRGGGGGGVSFALRPSSFLPSFTSLRSSSPSSLLPTSSSTSLARRPYSSHVPLTTTSSSKRTESESNRKQQHHQNEDSDSPDSDDSPPLPPNPSLSQRFKHLSKKYGWWAVGTYTILGLLDFGVAFVGVGLFGADKVAVVERKVVGWGYEQLGWEMKELTTEEKEVRKGGGKGGVWTQVAVAYTIHKTLFLPLRLALTGAVLPKLVAYMTRIGWAGKGARGVQAKVKQVVKDRAS